MGSAAASIPCLLVRTTPRAFNAWRRMIRRAARRNGDALTHGYPYEVRPRITHIDRAIIRAYFRQVGATAAQSGQEPQPESLAQESQHTQLPHELEQKLSVLEDGYRRVRNTSQVLLIEADSGTVVDALEDIQDPVEALAPRAI